MKLATAVWAALLVAGLGASAWQLLARHDEADAHVDEAAREFLLPERLAGVRAIELHRGAQIARFERDTEGRWFRHEHAAAPAPAASSLDLSAVYAHRHPAAPADTHRHDVSADEARRIEEALATFSRTQVERHVARGLQAARADYGLLQPALMVFVFGEAAAPMLSLAAGDAAPDGLGRYAGWRERDAVIVVAGYQIDKLTELLR